MSLAHKVEDCIYDKIIEFVTKRDCSLSDVLKNYHTRVDRITQAYGKVYKGRESHIYVKAYQGMMKDFEDHHR